MIDFSENLFHCVICIINSIVRDLGKVCEYLVAGGVEDHEALVEVVVLHGRRRVQLRQRVTRLYLQQKEILDLKQKFIIK